MKTYSLLMSLLLAVSTANAGKVRLVEPEETDEVEVPTQIVKIKKDKRVSITAPDETVPKPQRRTKPAVIDEERVELEPVTPKITRRETRPTVRQSPPPAARPRPDLGEDRTETRPRPAPQARKQPEAQPRPEVRPQPRPQAKFKGEKCISTLTQYNDPANADIKASVAGTNLFTTWYEPKYNAKVTFHAQGGAALTMDGGFEKKFKTQLCLNSKVGPVLKIDDKKILLKEHVNSGRPIKNFSFDLNGMPVSLTQNKPKAGASGSTSVANRLGESAP